MAKVLMVQGTMSNAGKSLVVAGLCRVFMQDGYRACPFKSQNMALNSYITDEGLEMGRAQVMQAEAAGIKPSVLMNPILLKPTSDMGSQIIVNGTSIGNMRAKEYFEYKHKLIPDIKEAFSKLCSNSDIIVIEGAGSPAEINLKDNDIVNMGMAKMVDAPVLLVGDIDRGGVFAQLLGTLMLLEDDERDRVEGLVINKFRGDKTILDPGIEMLEEKSGKKVVGTLPFTELTIDDEDSLSGRIDNRKKGLINIAVVRLPRMSNFSDFICFEQIPEAAVNYINSPGELSGADMLIIPGTKNTIADLIWMRESGMEAAVKKFSEHHPVFGICGGFQMMGRSISDPYAVEAGGGIEGMGLLKMDTVLTMEKTRRQVKGRFNNISGTFSFLAGKAVSGYEIHMGETKYDSDVLYATSLTTGSGTLSCNNDNVKESQTLICEDRFSEGIISGNICGSYVHGIFDEGDIALSLVKNLADRKGLDIALDQTASYEDFKQRQYDKLADMIRDNMDMESVYKMLREVRI